MTKTTLQLPDIDSSVGTKENPHKLNGEPYWVAAMHLSGRRGMFDKYNMVIRQDVEQWSQIIMRLTKKEALALAAHINESYGV